MTATAHAGRMTRFGLVGVLNTAVYYGTYLALRLLVPYLAAHVVATVVALTGSYYLNCRFTFRTRPAWRTFGLFPLTNVATTTVTTVGLPIAVEVFGVDERVAPILVQLAAVPVTYVVAHTVMLRRAPEPRAPAERR